MTNYEKLIQVLSELFQFDQSDLDFGIYRIMNHKRGEIEQFLNKDLLPQVRQVLEGEAQGGKASLKEELEKVEASVREAGMDPEQSPKVKELRQQLASGTDVGALENEVFSHLTSFFRRYYHQGDFISKRRYKEGVYAIPYQGEEVKLHWANHDQYYIKSSEHLSLFRFALGDKQHVEFRLVEADPDKDNQKAARGQERRFMLHTDQPCDTEGDTLRIWFHYAVPTPPSGKAQKQDDYNREALDALRKAVPKTFAGVWALQPTEKNPKRTLLEKRIKEYTARNTFDYFIHKHLGRFLRQELDFYIKNEVLHVDDFHTSDPEGVLRQMRFVRALKAIADKLITFLAQLEDFQKKLWLKKKFVTEAHYGITLDRVPKELYKTIAANAAQVEEWEQLYSISALKGGKKPSASFLEANPYLVLDTAHFTDSNTGHNPVKEALLKHTEDVDAQCDGLLVHGDNFQGLNVLENTFKKSINEIVIDPPYNTGNDGFVYKDGYEHSTWATMMSDRVARSRRLLSSDGVFFQTLDHHELTTSREILDTVFGADNFQSIITWQRKYGASNNAKDIAPMIDYIFCYQDSEDFEFGLFPRSAEAEDRYKNPDKDPRGPWKPVDYWNQASPQQRPNLAYTITNPNTKEKINPTKKAWKYAKETYDTHVKENRIYWGKDGKNTVPTLKRFLSEVRDGVVPTNFWNWEFAGHTDGAKKELEAILPDIDFPTPKPSKLIEKIAILGQKENKGIVLDYFAGSGTTGHAVINLNREDPDSERKYILCEMGQYFDTVLLPRIKKVVYSKDWKDGKPVGREGISHCFKYLRLESYEDALNNLHTERSNAQELALAKDAHFREGYMLGYWLDTETQGSQSLLNTARFDDPFNYFLDITRNNATAPQRIDLVETFSYLLGLHVRTIDHIEGFVVVQGENWAEENVLVIWRNTTEKNSAVLTAFVEKLGFHTKAPHFDRIYVNGDNTLENLKTTESQQWKVELIEEAFQRLMFEGVD